MRRNWETTFRITPAENAAFDARYEARIVAETAARAREICHHDSVDLARLDEGDPFSSSITAEDVKRTIRSFKNRRAPGTSGVKKEDLIQLPLRALEFLARAFTAAFSAGYFPEKFKHARLIFIAKSGKNPANPLHYRPISLLETPGKVLEKLLNERLSDFAEARRVHDPMQYGFRPRRGTGKAIALAYETVAQAVASGAGNATIIMRDIEKAFDKVYHVGMKHRLLEVGTPDLLRRMCCHFLDGRTAAIRVQGAEGPAFQLLSGVPQGSCLSPTMFIIYTADTPPPRVRDHSIHFAYADDHNQIVTFPFKFPRGTAACTQRAAQIRNAYERRKKIKNQLEKMNIITARRTKPFPLTIDGNRVPYTQEGKLLGLRMTLYGIRSQIYHLEKKGKRQLGKLRRFSGLPEGIKLYLFKALLRPLLEYPAVAISTASRAALLTLQRVQTKGLRWVFGRTPWHLRPTPVQLHQRYRVLPLNLRLHQLARRTWQSLADDDDPNLQTIVRVAETLEPGQEHLWWPRSRPRALGPPPAPLLTADDV